MTRCDNSRRIEFEKKYSCLRGAVFDRFGVCFGFADMASGNNDAAGANL